MNWIASNLVFLRAANGLKQAEISDKLGFKRNTWSNWETNVSEPDIETLLRIADYFRVDIGDIIGADLSTGILNKKGYDSKKQPVGNLKSSPTGNVMEPSAEYGVSPRDVIVSRSERRSPSVVSVSKEGDETIVYVPVKAQAGYLIGYGDSAYIEQLPAFNMPGLRNATFRMFEVQGVSMSPTLSDRDRVIGEWVASVDEIRENRVHVMVLKDGVCIKRVLNRTRERGKIYLKSDTLTHRQDYPIREIDPSEILEIW